MTTGNANFKNVTMT